MKFSSKVAGGLTLSKRRFGSRLLMKPLYLEFIHLIYDHVGRNRIPLPACAYHEIRAKFQPKDTTECFVDFQGGGNGKLTNDAIKIFRFIC